MRIDRRVGALLLALGITVTLAWFEARPPRWVRTDPLLRPFGEPREANDPSTARDSAKRTPVPVVLSGATAAELEALPGIGPTTAARILAWRDTTAAVDDVARLLEVRGIGPAKLEALRPWIRLEGLPSPSDSTLTTTRP